MLYVLVVNDGFCLLFQHRYFYTLIAEFMEEMCFEPCPQDCEDVPLGVPGPSAMCSTVESVIRIDPDT